MKMTLAVCALGFAIAASLTAQAQTVNDNGHPASAQAFALSGPVVPAGTGPICPPTGAVVSSFTGANTQDGRIFRDAIPSTCPVKAYPGIFGAGTTFNYETFTYSNTSAAAACVTVNFNPDTAGGTPCATNAHMSAYSGSYNPANQSANFLGDVGSSATGPFSIEIAGNAQLVLAVTNTSSAATCSFGFEVVNLPCSAATAANLGVTLTASATTAAPGAAVSFTATSTNLGPDSAQDVTVSIQLAPGFNFATVTAAGGVCTNPGVGNTGTVSCTFAGATALNGQRVVQVGATAGTTSGVAAVVASTSSPTVDPTPANNVVTASVTIAAPFSYVPVPTQTTLGLLLLGSLLAGMGWLASRRRV